MRALICGDRNWRDERTIRWVIVGLWNEAVSNYETLTIVHGCARGADSLAGLIAREMGVDVEEFPAKWDELGKKAGPLRNIQMLEDGRPDLVVAFHDNIAQSKGTRHMVTIARKAGLEVYLFARYTGAP